MESHVGMAGTAGSPSVAAVRPRWSSMTFKTSTHNRSRLRRRGLTKLTSYLQAGMLDACTLSLSWVHPCCMLLSKQRLIIAPTGVPLLLPSVMKYASNMRLISM